MVFFLATSQMEVVFRVFEILALQDGVQEQTAGSIMRTRIRRLNLFSNIFVVLVFATYVWDCIAVYKDPKFSKSGAYTMNSVFFAVISVMMLVGTLILYFVMKKKFKS